MRKWKAIRDSRLFPRPRLREREGEIRLSFPILSPLRLTFLQEAMLHPLMVIWRCVAVAFLLDCGAAYLKWFSLFDNYLPFSRLTFVVVMLVLLALWLIERFCRYPLCRRLLGGRIIIRITPDHLSYKTGWIFWKLFSRQQELAFAQVNFDGATTPAYKNSRLFCLIVGGIRRIEIAEIYNVGTLSQAVNNANVALMIGAELFDLDSDPLPAPLPLGALPQATSAP